MKDKVVGVEEALLKKKLTPTEMMSHLQEQLVLNLKESQTLHHKYVTYRGQWQEKRRQETEIKKRMIETYDKLKR